MTKGAKTAVAIVIVIVVVIGGYALLHKSSKKNNTTASTNSSSSQSSLPDVNNAVLVTKTDSKLGKYLADPNGNALYTYNSDTSGVSNCTGSCLASWPAYQDKGSTTNLPAGVGTIKRTDNGQTQYTFNGLPLYYFVSDTSGQVTGNGVQNFSVARPATPQTSSSSSSNSSSGSSSSSGNSNSPY